MKTCSIDGCAGKVLARTWCGKHYLRFYKHGDPLYVVDRKATAKRGADLPHTKHGLWSHSLYPTWQNMMARCYKAENARFSRYGGRGIYVCDRWHDVANFVADLGEKPDGKSLDRFNNDGPYSPENCRWATNVEQARNREQAIITDCQRRAACEMYELCRSPKKVAAQLGIKPGDVKNIVYGERKRATTERP